MHLLTPLVLFGIMALIMPGRKIPLVTNECYHVLNRGVASQPVFLNQKDYLRGLETIFYYQNQNIPLRYSFFLRLSSPQKKELLNKLKAKRKFLVEIIAFCLMPNHLHLLLKQAQDGGISIFMSNFANSYTRYFNTKQKRAGPLFQGKFQAVRVETEEQLIHLSRYIHLNPYSSYVVKSFSELKDYPYSSLSEHLQPKAPSHCNKEIVLQNFKSLHSYKKFVFDQAAYQRKLQEIRHLVLEE